MVDTKKNINLTFSQRNGLQSIPPQLELNEVSDEFRRLLQYYIDLDMQQATVGGYPDYCFVDHWKRISKDFHVRFLKQPYGTYINSYPEFRTTVETIVCAREYNLIFDLIEFLVGHKDCNNELAHKLNGLFEETRSAYRLYGVTIIPVGTEEQANALQLAIDDADKNGSGSIRNQLIEAGQELRNGNWAASVRHSIHAVEATAVLLTPDAPKADTLGAALNVLKNQGRLRHEGLKKAFSALYGYTSDEEGIRHATVFNSEADVDEADALFMHGACASFISYLLAQQR